MEKCAFCWQYVHLGKCPICGALSRSSVIKESPAKEVSISRRRRLLENEEREARRALDEHFKSLWVKFRSKCPHKNTYRHIDPAGGSDSWTECLDCGAEVK